MYLSQQDQDKIREFLKDRYIPSGLGDSERACSIAAINLALYGKLTDEIPECMSAVIGRWIIKIQDIMPEEMRNSKEWKELLPLAAGTGRKKEKERLKIIMKWMWQIVLPLLQPIADKHGFSKEWRTMCNKNTAAAAKAAAYVAYAAVYADAAANAAAANAAANAAAYAANAADYAAYAAKADYAAYANDFWKNIDPIGVLKDLVYLT